MLYELKGICHQCAAEYKTILSGNETHGVCNECGTTPVKFKKFKGMVYIINNPYQTGVKVGLTEKGLEQRIKQLQSSGVPGNFAIVAVFPSDNPKKDEKKAHDKLMHCNLEKEHFDIEPEQAVMAVHRALGYRTPIFFDKKMEQIFLEKKEEASQKMAKQLSGRKKQ